MERINLSLDSNVEVIFKDKEGNTASIEMTFKELLDKTTDDLYEELDLSEGCTSSSCHNESFNGCDCGSEYEDYEINEVVLDVNTKSDELFGLIESIHHLFESDKPITKESVIGHAIELAYKTFKD